MPICPRCKSLSADFIKDRRYKQDGYYKCIICEYEYTTEKDSEITMIKCYSRMNTIAKTKVSRLKKTKRGVVFTTEWSTDPVFYVADENHAKLIIEALTKASNMGWFEEK